MTEIKVGSEWVSSMKDHNDRLLTVVAMSEKSAILQWNDNGREFSVPLCYLKEIYKPAPVRRTVWLNVYEDEVQCYNSEIKADNNIGYGLLWQQEVELIDPREGGAKA